MDNFFNNLPNNFFNNKNLGNLNLDLDINKILVILLLLTDKLDIEAIHIYRNNFIISLGTFNDDWGN